MIVMDGRETESEHSSPTTRRGRPVKGAGLVASLDTGSDLAKARLEAILRTLEGAWTIEEGCARLGIGRSAFHKMRTRFLERATSLLEPQTRGPKPKQELDVADAAEMETLRSQVQELELKVLTAEMREDLALAATPQRTADAPASRPQKERRRGKKRRRKRR